ncbi:hypothetical protein H6P81_007294 [Aristolochia fimbriata]|uniref:RING-type domain-containing protein n=1 Tax=Aristolochia fimbriata TaxID=158543 RepID=A0AAV7F202_ARIFI|nr:hypothetical protein H6P81_007294 [Aristolochia fimbriata]
MAAPDQNLSFAIAFSPSYHAPSEAPTVVFSFSGQKNCYVVDGSGAENRAAVTQIRTMPRKSFHFPLCLLFAPLQWRQTASSMLSSFNHYSSTGTAAAQYSPLLLRLCDLVPARADLARSHGYSRLDVVIDVRMWVPLVLPTAVPVPSAAREEVQLFCGSGMKLKELGEIGGGETCAICFEEFGESKKVVTETPCAHLFHSDCLLPWLVSATTSTTCPLCRSTLH